MRRKIASVLPAVLILVALTACNEPSGDVDEPQPTAREETEKFELVGSVTAVEIDDLDEGATPSPSPTDDDGFDARLTVELQSINDPAGDLCDVSRGDEIELIVDLETEIVPTKALADLDDFEDQKISAGGTATATTDGCIFTAASLRIVPADQGDGSPAPSPTSTGDGGEDPTPSPTPTY